MNAIKIFVALIIFLGFSVKSDGQYQKVNNNGLDIYYRIFGEGVPILIIGGGPGDNSDRYLSLCDLLAKNFKCILVDQRGTGKSTPDVMDSTNITVALTLSDFEAVRGELGLKDWNVLGFSYGGFIASIYSNYYPASIKSLITMGSIGFDFGIYRYFNDNIKSRLHSGDLELLKYWSDSTRMANNHHHAIVETIRAKMSGYFFDREKALIVSQDMKDSDFNFDMGNWISMDIEKNYMKMGDTKSNFEKPVLIIQGRQDPIGENAAIKISNYYKQPKVVYIEQSGHYSWVEQPDKIFTTIKKFLEQDK